MNNNDDSVNTSSSASRGCYLIKKTYCTSGKAKNDTITSLVENKLKKCAHKIYVR